MCPISLRWQWATYSNRLNDGGGRCLALMHRELIHSRGFKCHRVAPSCLAQTLNGSALFLMKRLAACAKRDYLFENTGPHGRALGFHISMTEKWQPERWDLHKSFWGCGTYCALFPSLFSLCQVDFFKDTHYNLYLGSANTVFIFEDQCVYLQRLLFLFWDPASSDAYG